KESDRDPCKHALHVRPTPAITCGPRRARALRAAGGGSEVRSLPRCNARDRPDRQVHRVVGRRGHPFHCPTSVTDHTPSTFSTWYDGPASPQNFVSEVGAQPAIHIRPSSQISIHRTKFIPGAR